MSTSAKKRRITADARPLPFTHCTQFALRESAQRSFLLSLGGQYAADQTL